MKKNAFISLLGARNGTFNLISWSALVCLSENNQFICLFSFVFYPTGLDLSMELIQTWQNLSESVEISSIPCSLSPQERSKDKKDFRSEMSQKCSFLPNFQFCLCFPPLIPFFLNILTYRPPFSLPEGRRKEIFEIQYEMAEKSHQGFAKTSVDVSRISPLCIFF